MAQKNIYIYSWKSLNELRRNRSHRIIPKRVSKWTVMFPSSVAILTSDNNNFITTEKEEKEYNNDDEEDHKFWNTNDGNKEENTNFNSNRTYDKFTNKIDDNDKERI